MAAPLIEAITGPVIAAGQSLSSPVNLTGSNTLLRVWMPAAWEDAPLTFQISYDGVVPYRDLFEEGRELIRTVTPGTIHVIEPLWGRCLPYIKFRSGTSAKPVIQSAARQFTCIVEK